MAEVPTPDISELYADIPIIQSAPLFNINADFKVGEVKFNILRVYTEHIIALGPKEAVLIVPRKAIKSWDGLVEGRVRKHGTLTIYTDVTTYVFDGGTKDFFKPFVTFLLSPENVS